MTSAIPTTITGVMASPRKNDAKRAISTSIRSCRTVSS